jgi:hypothetical protein
MRPTVIAAGARLPEPEVDELEPDADAAPGSVLAQMRAAAEVQRKARTLELAVGGALERLVIRYRVLERREWDKYAVLLTPAATAGGTGDLPPMSVLNARMMAAACETVLWRDDDDELADLEVRLDGRLAKLLGYPLPAGMDYDDLGVLEVVEGLFASPMAVTAHAGELVQWMQNPGGAEGET